jgi:hypothetical protein
MVFLIKVVVSVRAGRADSDIADVADAAGSVSADVEGVAAGDGVSIKVDPPTGADVLADVGDPSQFRSLVTHICTALLAHVVVHTTARSNSIIEHLQRQMRHGPAHCLQHQQRRACIS